MTTLNPLGGGMPHRHLIDPANVQLEDYRNGTNLKCRTCGADICGSKSQKGVSCMLDKGHKGYHSNPWLTSAGKSIGVTDSGPTTWA